MVLVIVAAALAVMTIGVCAVAARLGWFRYDDAAADCGTEDTTPGTPGVTTSEGAGRG